MYLQCSLFCCYVQFAEIGSDQFHSICFDFIRFHSIDSPFISMDSTARCGREMCIQSCVFVLYSCMILHRDCQIINAFCLPKQTDLGFQRDKIQSAFTRYARVPAHCPSPTRSYSSVNLKIRLLAKKRTPKAYGSVFRQSETKSLCACVRWKLSVNAKSIQMEHKHKTHIRLFIVVMMMMIINGLHQHNCHPNQFIN